LLQNKGFQGYTRGS